MFKNETARDPKHDNTYKAGWVHVDKKNRE